MSQSDPLIHLLPYFAQDRLDEVFKSLKKGELSLRQKWWMYWYELNVQCLDFLRKMGILSLRKHTQKRDQLRGLILNLAKEVFSEPEVLEKRRMQRRKRLLRIAASILAVVVLLGGWYYYTTRPSESVTSIDSQNNDNTPHRAQKEPGAQERDADVDSTEERRPPPEDSLTVFFENSDPLKEGAWYIKINNEPILISNKGQLKIGRSMLDSDNTIIYAIIKDGKVQKNARLTFDTKTATIIIPN